MTMGKFVLNSLQNNGSEIKEGEQVCYFTYQQQISAGNFDRVCQ